MDIIANCDHEFEVDIDSREIIKVGWGAATIERADDDSCWVSSCPRCGGEVIIED